MAKTHEVFKTNLFFQFLNVKKGTPLVHKAIQSQETDGPFRKAQPLVFRVPFLGVSPYLYKGLGGKRVTVGVTLTWYSAIAVGYWRETGYEEHEALTHALNVNDDHANDRATDFETSAAGLQNASTELGKSAQPIIGDGDGDSPNVGTAFVIRDN